MAVNLVLLLGWRVAAAAALPAVGVVFVFSVGGWVGVSVGRCVCGWVSVGGCLWVGICVCVCVYKCLWVDHATQSHISVMTPFYMYFYICLLNV